MSNWPSLDPGDLLEDEARRVIRPNGCSWCGRPRGSHGRVLHDQDTWHVYAPPTPEQKATRKADVR